LSQPVRSITTFRGRFGFSVDGDASDIASRERAQLFFRRRNSPSLFFARDGVNCRCERVTILYKVVAKPAN